MATFATEYGTAGSYDPAVTFSSVIARFDSVCQACGKVCVRGSANWRDQPSIEHKVPLAMGGDHSVENTTLLCRECNSRRRHVVCPNCCHAFIA